MARTKSARRPKSQAGSQEEATGPAADGPVSRTDAVKAALGEGKETPEEGVSFIKERYGIEMSC